MTGAAKPVRVAGVYTPAFVERSRRPLPSAPRNPRVAGVYTPAFVERRSRASESQGQADGVAGVYTPAFVERTGMPGRSGAARRRCRRSLYSGLR